MSKHALEEQAAAQPGLVVGVTMEQLDALNRLVQLISAHGDLVAATNPADTARHTLPVVGQAIHEGAASMRRILDQVEVQPLGPARGHDGAAESRGAYVAGSPGRPAGWAPGRGAFARFSHVKARSLHDPLAAGRIHASATRYVRSRMR